jgi:hypothetical protein
MYTSSKHNIFLFFTPVFLIIYQSSLKNILNFNQILISATGEMYCQLNVY